MGQLDQGPGTGPRGSRSRGEARSDLQKSREVGSGNCVGGGGAPRSRHPWNEAKNQRTGTKDICGDSRLLTTTKAISIRVDSSAPTLATDWI